MPFGMLDVPHPFVGPSGPHSPDRVAQLKRGIPVSGVVAGQTNAFMVIAEREEDENEDDEEEEGGGRGGEVLPRRNASVAVEVTRRNHHRQYLSQVAYPRIQRFVDYVLVEDPAGVCACPCLCVDFVCVCVRARVCVRYVYVCLYVCVMQHFDARAV